MNPTGKKFISLFLVFSLMMLSVNLYAKERRGAKLIITKKDGQQVEGELIAVKIPQKSLLLLDTEGKDVSIDMGDVQVIEIMKKVKFSFAGAVLGAVFGGIIGAKIGRSKYLDDPEVGSAVGIIIGVPSGLVVGGCVGGLVVGIDKTVQIEGKSDVEIKRFLLKLSKKARVRDYK